SPVHMSNLTGPLISVSSRLQVYYNSKRFLNNKINPRYKDGILILTGGGDGSADCAIAAAEVMFKLLNAAHPEQNNVFSLNTDNLPACQDAQAINKIKKIAKRINVKS
ncbi:MAG: flavodoxin family protein, partial [Eubacteriaceae bacterium]|nr:flavodoxin family protein [Eubacteriaceae bacterium]